MKALEPWKQRTKPQLRALRQVWICLCGWRGRNGNAIAKHRRACKEANK